MNQNKKTNKGSELWGQAKKRIPGGAQLFSKRAELSLPGGAWPTYYDKARGISVWDLEGKEYKDFSLMGVGSCTLGYADRDVNMAVKKAIDRGSMCTLNVPEEVELANLLCTLHPWAGMVRYARTGGEAMAVAVRIARAHTGRDKVALCGYHGWMDWYLSANLADEKNLDGHLLPGLEPSGVPRALLGTSLAFGYNRIEELERLAEKYSDIGVIVIEPLRHQEPVNDFLKQARKVADSIGAVLIFDEVSIGWRVTLGGVHLKYGVNPDIAVFGKAMSNGYPMSAIIGKENIMRVAEKTFISSTYWTEAVGTVAALATIKKMRERDVPTHLSAIGAAIGEGWKRLAHRHGLSITLTGPEALITFTFDYGSKSQAIRTLFTQEMLKRGYLATTTVYVSYAHTKKDVVRYLKAVDEVFVLLKDAISKERVDYLLEGPVAQSGFKRLT